MLLSHRAARTLPSLPTTRSAPAPSSASSAPSTSARATGRRLIDLIRPRFHPQLPMPLRILYYILYIAAVTLVCLYLSLAFDIVQYNAPTSTQPPTANGAVPTDSQQTLQDAEAAAEDIGLGDNELGAVEAGGLDGYDEEGDEVDDWINGNEDNAEPNTDQSTLAAGEAGTSVEADNGAEGERVGGDIPSTSNDIEAPVEHKTRDHSLDYELRINVPNAIHGELEQSNVETFSNGILSIYPFIGSEKGGSDITFVFAQLVQREHYWPSKAYFGGCVIDGVWTPITNAAVYEPGTAYLLTCKLPPHAPGEVDVALIVENTTRYVDNGTIRFTYLPESEVNVTVTGLALCTVFQNQALYLREWIAFHTIFGVSKFYLYDQGSTDNWRETIQDYIDQGIAVPIHWQFSWFSRSIRHQAIAFWHAVRSFGTYTKWMGFIDVDEFLFMPKLPTGETPSLISFLQAFEDAGGVMIDRFNFGANNHTKRPAGLVIENYTARTGGGRVEVKSLVQPRYVRWSGCGGVHTFSYLKGHRNVDAANRTREDGCGMSEHVVAEPVRINHYWTKSVEDFALRLSRDSNPYKMKAEDILLWTYFKVTETDILLYANETKERMAWNATL